MDSCTALQQTKTSNANAILWTSLQTRVVPMGHSIKLCNLYRGGSCLVVSVLSRTCIEQSFRLIRFQKRWTRTIPGNHCPAKTVGDTPWWDFRASAEWVVKTYRRRRDCPPINNTLFTDDSLWSRMSVFSDYMHDKHLGTDKAPYSNTL